MGGDRSSDEPAEERFDRFARDADQRLWLAVVGVAGPERASEAVNEALVWAWRHWDRVEAMDNPLGYLYRMASREAVRARPGVRPVGLPEPPAGALPDVEPGLVPALRRLTEPQRLVVWLVDACGWGLTDTARLLGISVSTVRNHRARGMQRLRDELEVTTDAG